MLLLFVILGRLEFSHVVWAKFYEDQKVSTSCICLFHRVNYKLGHIAVETSPGLWLLGCVARQAEVSVHAASWSGTASFDLLPGAAASLMTARNQSPSGTRF